MEEIREAKRQIRQDMTKWVEGLSENDLAEKTRRIENRLFDFANFQEARIPLLYVDSGIEIATETILKNCFRLQKILVLPAFGKDRYKVTLMKVDNLETDLKVGPRGIAEPDPQKCKVVPIECIDIAVVPSLAVDEKGGRIGSGDGYYDRLIPKLPITTRKVTLALEGQVIPQIPMESHDKYVDIVITDERIIYKI